MARSQSRADVSRWPEPRAMERVWLRSGERRRWGEVRSKPISHTIKARSGNAAREATASLEEKKR
eukprot:1252019-Pleurochrysis_carterae.AAC.1